MVLEFFRGGADKPLEEIEALIVQMLLDDRHTFDLAIGTVVGGADPAAVDKEVHKSDRRVNKAEREVRRRLVVHASIKGKGVDLPRVLVSMSIVRDAERIGDQCKNIWDLANNGIDLVDSERSKWLTSKRDETSRLIGECARIYGERDTEAVHELIPRLDKIVGEYEGCVQAQVSSDRPSSETVPMALLCRYLKRIVANLLNILTSLVMPVDRLYYYDEERSDREPE